MENLNVFNQLVGLDEAEFARKRQELIREFLESVPAEKRKKFLAMQYNIDLRLERSKDPLVEINGLMWDSFLDLNRALNNGVETKKSNVIQFPEGNS